MANSSIYNTLFNNNNLKGGTKTANIIKLILAKKEFLVLVFSNLIAQLGITYYVMNKSLITVNKKNYLLMVILEFAIIFSLMLVPMNPFIKFLLFSLFSFIFGIILSGIKNKYSSQMINLAIQSTLSIFAVMLAGGVALIFGGINLGYKFGLLLLISLLLLIIARLVLIWGLNMTNMNKTLSFIGILIFAAYILYDTNIILQRNYDGDFITASLDYYLDIINLFLNILRNKDD